MPPTKTALGSPLSPRWDDAWTTTVSKTEYELGHRICGARTHADTPCTLKPNHPNGRCKFHGGFDLTGAQPGNRNAVIHGLYTRALRICGPQCPLWNECPCAGDDVAQLSPAERPTCPYETMEYQTAVTDIAANTDICVESDICVEFDPLSRRIVRQAALLHVMMSRALIALRDAPLILDTGAKSDNYQHISPKPNPLLDAYFRIAREYRNCLKWLEDNQAKSYKSDRGLAEYQRRAHDDTSLDPDVQAQLDTTENLAEQRAKGYMSLAVEHSEKSNVHVALWNRNRAKKVAPDTPAIWDIQLPHELEAENNDQNKSQKTAQKTASG